MRNRKESASSKAAPAENHPLLRTDADMLEQLCHARDSAAYLLAVPAPDLAHLEKCRDLAIATLDLLIDAQRLYKQYSYSSNPAISEILDTADSTELRTAPDNLARYLKSHYSDALVVEDARTRAVAEYRAQVGLRLDKKMVCYSWKGSAQQLHYDALLLAHTISDDPQQSDHHSLEQRLACSPMWLYALLKKRTMSTFVLSPPVPAPASGAALALLGSPALAHYSLNERVGIVQALAPQTRQKLKIRSVCRSFSR